MPEGPINPAIWEKQPMTAVERDYKIAEQTPEDRKRRVRMYWNLPEDAEIDIASPQVNGRPVADVEIPEPESLQNQLESGDMAPDPNSLEGKVHELVNSTVLSDPASMVRSNGWYQARVHPNRERAE